MLLLYYYIIYPFKLSLPIYSLFSSQLFYFGKIKQSTGEDWDDASLSLSTAMPSVGGTPPELEMLRVHSVSHYQKSMRQPLHLNALMERSGVSQYDDSLALEE